MTSRTWSCMYMETALCLATASTRTRTVKWWRMAAVTFAGDLEMAKMALKRTIFLIQNPRKSYMKDRFARAAEERRNVSAEVVRWDKSANSNKNIH